MAFKDSTDEKFQDQINGSKLNLIQFSAVLVWTMPAIKTNY
jgi:hypothetical protein